MIQRRYRSKHESDLVGTKITLQDIVKAIHFIHGARAKYEQEPHKLSNIVNFALLVHCVDLDFSKARPIYEKALELSKPSSHFSGLWDLPTGIAANSSSYDVPNRLPFIPRSKCCRPRNGQVSIRS